MLTRPPPPQCRSFFCVQPLHGCWHAIISDQNKNATTRPGSYMCPCIFIHSKLCTAHLIASLTSLFCVHVHFRFCSEQLWDRLIGLILNLESQRCDCHLIVIRSKLASALVSFLQLIMYCPTQAVHVAYQGTAGVVIDYDIESRHGCWRHLFSHYAAIFDADSRSLSWLTTLNACALQSSPS